MKAITNNMLPILLTLVLLHAGNPSPNLSSQESMQGRSRSRIERLQDSAKHHQRQHFLNLDLANQTLKD